jgi:hypothetical protein
MNHFCIVMLEMIDNSMKMLDNTKSDDTERDNNHSGSTRTNEMTDNSTWMLDNSTPLHTGINLSNFCIFVLDKRTENSKKMLDNTKAVNTMRDNDHSGSSR